MNLGVICGHRIGRSGDYPGPQLYLADATTQFTVRIIENQKMPRNSKNLIVYASFDRFPSPKGAATHIDAFVSALGSRFGDVRLITIESEHAELSDAPQPQVLKHFSHSEETRVDWTPAPNWNATGVRHHPLPAIGENLFERTLSFRREMQHWWCREIGDQPVSVVHFRSVFEGYWIAQHKNGYCRNLVFEVNGLPSIELKYHYPGVAGDHELLRKLRHQEQVCLDAADRIVTVSQVNADHLISRGVDANKICVIRNGVHSELFQCKIAPPDTNLGCVDRPIRMLYSGTMSAWQGVPHAIEAVALLRRDVEAELTLVGPARPRQLREMQDQIWKLGLTDAVHIRKPVSKSELVTLHHAADVALAPMTRNDRNLVQGCCPLKVLEAMACGIPLVASDLPVVRELVTDGVEALLVRPGSGKAIKDGVLKLISEQGLAESLSAAARRRVEDHFSWQRAQSELIAVYESLLEDSSSRRSSGASRSASASS